MERLTLFDAQARIVANTGSDSLVDPASIDWTQPAREAVTIAGLVQSTDDLDERSRITAVALALLGYAAHLDFEAGKVAQREETAALCERRAKEQAKHFGTSRATLATGKADAFNEVVRVLRGEGSAA